MRFFRVVFLFLLSGFSSISGYSQSITGEQLQGQDQFQIDPESTNGYVYGKAIDFDIDNETGKRVVVWEEREANGTTSGNRDIFFQIFDKDMDPITVALDAAETKLLDQYSVKVKINQQDNTFVIAWTSNHGGSNDIYAKKYNLENGNAITASYLVNHQSTPLNFNEDKSQTLPYLTFDYAKNELVIGWLDLDGRDGGVYAANTGSYAVRMNYSSFTTIGNEFQINGNGLNSTIQRLFGLEISPVTGDLLTICQSMGYPNAGNWDIVFRKFTRNSSGDFIGEPEFVVNDITTGTQDSPYLGINRTTGDYIITYTDSDGHGSGSFAQVYDKYGNSIGNKFRINVPISENQRYPKAAWDELTNTIVFFYYYTYSSVANIKYQIYNDEVIPLGTETNALPSSVNLRYNWQEHFFQYDQKRKKVVLAYKEYQSNSSTANTKIFLRQLKYEHPDFAIQANANLSKKLNGAVYYTFNKKLYFNYIEEYVDGGTLKFKVYDSNRIIKLDNSGLAIPKTSGHNELYIDFTNLALTDGAFYTLEVIDEKKNISKLKFQYKDE